ncbi:MAG TPA: 2Fe-2S iron-sulfur cluster-binding protein, partial [Kribbella sp.]
MTTQALRAPALTVNGELTAIGAVSVHTTVLDWLRDRGLTGAKEGCAEGECGACSVLVARPGIDSETEWTAVNACLLPVASLDGQELMTAEGLGTPSELHPVQQEMAVRGGSQCGFCTPGFICSMAAEYYRPGRACGEGDHEHGANGFDLHALSGNLCRCTGYRPIRDAAYALDMPAENDALAVRRDTPPPAPASTGMVSPEGKFVRPASLDQALAVLGDRDDAVVVAG